MSTPAFKISVSIVSHMQADMVQVLLADLERCCKTHLLEVILTLNLPEKLNFDTSNYFFPVILHTNTEPKGFSANHNQALAQASGQFYCVMNPDIRFNEDPFPALLTCMQDSTVGVAAPLVLCANGTVEDSARRFPTPATIICKLFGRCQGNDYFINDAPVRPDWVAGMFLLFPRTIFERLGGFDQTYFLYYEDVDICARLRLLGYEVVLCPQAQVIHHAQRTSHRSLRYLRWHLASMLRFFFSPVFLRIQWQRLRVRRPEPPRPPPRSEP